MLAITDPEASRGTYRWSFIVDPARLAYDSGDLAKALDIGALERGLAWRTTWIDGHLLTITGAAGCCTDNGYALLHGLVLVPLEEFGGPVHTPHQARQNDLGLEGTLIESRYGTCAIAGEALIAPRAL